MKKQIRSISAFIATLCVILVAGCSPPAESPDATRKLNSDVSQGQGRVQFSGRVRGFGSRGRDVECNAASSGMPCARDRSSTKARKFPPKPAGLDAHKESRKSPAQGSRRYATR